RSGVWSYGAVVMGLRGMAGVGRWLGASVGGGKAERGAPGIGDAAVGIDGVPRSCEALGGGHDVGLEGEDEAPLEEARVLVPSGRRARSPRVETEVVVVTAGREEQRAGVAPDDLIEPERLVVERGGAVELAHVEVDV